MLDRVDFDHALHEGGRTLHRFYIGCCGIDDRLIRQIGALEFESMADRRWQDGECDIFARVKGAASQAGG